MTSVLHNVRTALDRIDKTDPQINAVLSTLKKESLKRANDLDAGGANGTLHGQTVAVKDNICTDVGATTCGSRILENFRAPYNAHVIDRLLDAGAVIVAKTNLDEFAMGSSTENSGFFTTRNPWDLERVAGGSSGGSVAAVATGMVPYALGSETGGSIRQPAAFCGVCGLKPTYGRVSRYGLVAFGSSLDQIGPVATDVPGLARLLGAIAGRDVRDSTSVDESVPDYLGRLDEPVGKVRIGIAAEYFGEGLDNETGKAVEAAIDVYKKLGAEVHEIHLPHSAYTIACYYIICTAEASSNLARFDGVRYGHRTANPQDYMDVYSSSREEGFGAEVKRRIMLGTYALSSGYYDAYYLKALKVRTLIKNDFVEAFKKCDVILSPTTPTPAFKLGEKSDPLAMYLADIYTCAANLAGTPAISIPCGFTESKLPIGLQLIAPHFAEDRLLQIAAAFQQATEYHQLRPPICATH
ncbi:MAG: Asp-tRNA(Asn)/Glu-tRNA(Gln) amidotransferase subunit GatA [Phycisphaerales bacterium]|nr:Asp-tRNA(Asn)/Glu-tRNA(Gln) amidotransferase subunit GatA [Phycisphaerales bacterium]